MKNRYLYIALCAAGILSGATSCNDYLETSSPSTVDKEFVFSTTTTKWAALEGAKKSMMNAYTLQVFGSGLYYAADIAGSDIMRHPEAHNNQLGRHIPEGLYRNGTEVGNYNLLSYQKEGTDGAYGALFDVIGKCNAITSAFEEGTDFSEMMAQTKPTDESQIYGEAVALRATCYRELIKYFGDVPCPAEFGKPAGGIASRDSIYDVCIEQLKKVEPLMSYWVLALTTPPVPRITIHAPTSTDSLAAWLWKLEVIRLAVVTSSEWMVKVISSPSRPWEQLTLVQNMAAVQTGRIFTTLPRPTSRKPSIIQEQPYSTIPTHVRKTIRDVYSATLISISSSRCTRLMLLMLTKASSRCHTPRALMVV